MATPRLGGQDVVGLLPAAGQATRLGGAVTGSKEAVEVGGEPAAGHLLNGLIRAGVGRAIVVLRADKVDVPAALARYEDIQIEYVTIEASPSELHSVVAGLQAAKDKTIALGYPDILFEPGDAYVQLIERLHATTPDVVLGLFPSDTPERVDMVALDGEARPVEVVIKQPDRGLRYSWALAVWSPSFTDTLIDMAVTSDPGSRLELSVGHAVQKAIECGLVVEAVPFETGKYLDIGTPGDLETARGRFTRGQR